MTGRINRENDMACPFQKEATNSSIGSPVGVGGKGPNPLIDPYDSRMLGFK
jgi:hypothetical protein